MAQRPYTVAECARVSGWSTKYIYGLIATGKLDLIPEDLGKGRPMRVSLASLKALMEKPNE